MATQRPRVSRPGTRSIRSQLHSRRVRDRRFELTESAFALSGLPNDGETSFSQLWNGAVRTWDALSSQTAALLPPVHATLAPPANAAAWREFVADLSLPSERDTGVLIDRLLPLRMLTLQHDGQVGLAPPFTPAASRATRFAVALC